MTGRSSGGGGTGGRAPVLRWPSYSFLGSLTDDERKSLLQLGAWRMYQPGKIILRQGAQGEFVVLILRGMAKVSLVAETGNEMLASIVQRS